MKWENPLRGGKWTITLPAMIRKYIEKVKSLYRISKYHTLRIVRAINLRMLTRIIIVESLLFFILRIDYHHQNIASIIGYTITVSGIFSGIVIAFISAKIFQLKSEYELRQVEINKLSDKLTNFRKLLYYVMNSDGFWVKWDDIVHYRRVQKNATYDTIHYHDGDNEVANNFWADNNKLSRTTIDLYLSMNAIFDDPDSTPFWIFSRRARFNYRLDQLKRYYEPSNQIWYYLQGRYEKHTVGLIKDHLLNRRDVYQIREHAGNIDIKFKNRDVDKNLIADIGTEFYEVLLPKLYELTELNQKGIPRGTKLLVYSVVFILLFGVMIPLVFSISSINITVGSLILKLIVGVVIALFTNFIIDFIKILNKEVKITS